MNGGEIRQENGFWCFSFCANKLHCASKWSHSLFNLSQMNKAAPKRETSKYLTIEISVDITELDVWRETKRRRRRRTTNQYQFDKLVDHVKGKAQCDPFFSVCWLVKMWMCCAFVVHRFGQWHFLFLVFFFNFSIGRHKAILCGVFETLKIDDEYAQNTQLFPTL